MPNSVPRTPTFGFLPRVERRDGAQVTHAPDLAGKKAVLRQMDALYEEAEQAVRTIEVGAPVPVSS